jgi:lipid II isoglutaminyl synthase (glutamine-hydrolysing)
MTDLGGSGARAGDSTLRVVHLYPHLLGTYGDAGNSIVLRARAQARGIGCEVVAVQPGQPVPRDGDIYLLGGGEDAKQTAAAAELRASGALTEAAAKGAAVLGICAGYQLLGQRFLGVGGVATDGLGLLDVTTDRLPTRAVGNMLAHSDVAGLGELIGFENHGGATTLGPGAQPLGQVEIGVGNGAPAFVTAAIEGAIQGRVVGTYLHGPALALNPALADLLLGWVAGPLAELDDELCLALRRHRREQVLPQAARATGRRRLLDRFRGKDSGVSGATATLSPTSST